jgi:hypothetical protein
VVRITIRHALCDKVRVEDLNLDAQFLQPPPGEKHRVGAHPVQNHRVGAHPVTRQQSMLLDDLGCGLGHAPGARL